MAVSCLKYDKKVGDRLELYDLLLWSRRAWLVITRCLRVLITRETFVERLKKNRCYIVVNCWMILEGCLFLVGQAKRLGDLDWSGTVVVHQAYELGSGRVPR